MVDCKEIGERWEKGSRFNVCGGAAAQESGCAGKERESGWLIGGAGDLLEHAVLRHSDAISMARFIANHRWEAQ